MDQAAKSSFQFFVSHLDPAEFLRLTDQLFDAVACAVGGLVQPSRFLGVRAMWNHRLGSKTNALLSLLGPVESFVANDLVHHGHPFRRLIEHGIQLRGVMVLPRHDVDRNRCARVGRAHQDFTVKSALAPTKTLLGRRPFFFVAPAAWRWARTIVKSTSTRWMSANSGPWPTRTAAARCRSPPSVGSGYASRPRRQTHREDHTRGCPFARHTRTPLGLLHERIEYTPRLVRNQIPHGVLARRSISLN